MKIQCLYYALDKWEETGGYLLFRKSVHWCMPHVLHLDNKTNKVTHYVPPDDLKYPWYSMLGFEGYIKEGDTEECERMNPLCMFLGTIALLLLGCRWYINRLLTRKNNRSYERRTSSRYVVDRRKK